MGSYAQAGLFQIQALSNVLVKFAIRVTRNGHVEVPTCTVHEEFIDVEIPASQIGICLYIEGTLYDNFAKGWYVVHVKKQWWYANT